MRTVVTLLLLLALAACGSESETVPSATVVATSSTTIHTAVLPIPVLPDMPPDQRTFKENVTVTVSWSTIEQIQQRAKDDGYSNWDSVHGLAYTSHDACVIYVEAPESYTDVLRLYIIGHELLHCWGWSNHGG